MPACLLPAPFLSGFFLDCEIHSLGSWTQGHFHSQHFEMEPLRGAEGSPAQMALRVSIDVQRRTLCSNHSIHPAEGSLTQGCRPKTPLPHFLLQATHWAPDPTLVLEAGWVGSRSPEPHLGLVVVLHGHGDDVDPDDEGDEKVEVVAGAQRVDGAAGG